MNRLLCVLALAIVGLLAPACATAPSSVFSPIATDVANGFSHTQWVVKYLNDGASRGGPNAPAIAQAYESLRVAYNNLGAMHVQIQNTNNVNVLYQVSSFDRLTARTSGTQAYCLKQARSYAAKAVTALGNVAAKSGSFPSEAATCAAAKADLQAAMSGL